MLRFPLPREARCDGALGVDGDAARSRPTDSRYQIGLRCRAPMTHALLIAGAERMAAEAEPLHAMVRRRGRLHARSVANRRLRIARGLVLPPRHVSDEQFRRAANHFLVHPRTQGIE